MSEPPNRPETPQRDHSPGLAEPSCGLTSETPPPGRPPEVAAGDLASEAGLLLRAGKSGSRRAVHRLVTGAGSIRHVSSEATGIRLWSATDGLAAAVTPETI